ncbi:MAG: amidohydrolase family protein [Planctomycetota bacterium]|jgi:predicted TIM-barrel fold metal-dependent hydrolase
MIVDCHTHIGPAADDYELSEHLATARKVDVCVVLAASGGPGNEINRKLAQYVNRHSDRMVGFAVVEPGTNRSGPGDLKAIPEKLGLKGLVLHCSAGGFHPAHSEAMKLYESAQELGLPVFFHNSGEALGADAVLAYAQPYLLDEIAREFTELKIVIGSMGFPFVEQTLSMVARHRNVYADLTIRPLSVWQTYNMVVAAYERGVMDKLVFGSGFPSGDVGQCMEALLGFNMLLADTNLPTVPRGSIRNVIERNALKLLGIDDESIRVRQPDSEEIEEHGNKDAPEEEPEEEEEEEEEEKEKEGKVTTDG